MSEDKETLYRAACQITQALSDIKPGSGGRYTRRQRVARNELLRRLRVVHDAISAIAAEERANRRFA